MFINISQVLLFGREYIMLILLREAALSAKISNFMDDKKLWGNVLVEMELNVSKANFTTWLKDTYIIKQEEGAVHVGVPNPFVKDWLVNKFHKLILRAL